MDWGGVCTRTSGGFLEPESCIRGIQFAAQNGDHAETRNTGLSTGAVLPFQVERRKKLV